MKNILSFIIFYFSRLVFWFRYRVKIKGLDQLNPHTLSRSGGILFLPNHPTIFVDPSLITLAILKKYPVRPLIVEYMYYTPIVHSIMLHINALAIPDFVSSSNTLKKKKAEKVFDCLIEGLKKGENFLVYPAGRVKHQAKEIIGAASGVHKIISSVPNANIVLVRITGLWGSKFSRALTAGRPAPFMFDTISWGIKQVFKNLLFFTPRREVTIEFTPAGEDFPYNATKLELNRYLENWYNRPDEADKASNTTNSKISENNFPGESLRLVSYSMWKTVLPKVEKIESKATDIDLSKIPPSIQKKIKEKLAEMSQMAPEDIQAHLNLSADLGLDSLDLAEIISYLDLEFDLAGVSVPELTTVEKVMSLAAHQVDYEIQAEPEVENIQAWFASLPQQIASMPEGKTIHEVFLRGCEKWKKRVACSDNTSGIITYCQAKFRITLLAEYIRKLPGEYIGILLPSSITAYLLIVACQLAGKIPLLVNWTVGTRHLESVLALSKVQAILSSWSFIDRLDNVDLTPIENQLILLEDVKRGLSLSDKCKGFIRSSFGIKSLLSTFGVQDMTGDEKAVLLFTSGTEGMPKGVPLSHKNILMNQRASVEEVGIFQNDILLGILPPFHAFGFTISGLLPLLCGIRVVYYPNPTDGKRLAQAIERWKVTLVCGTPSFLKGILKNGTVKQFKSLRLCVTGAEKAPEDLFEKVKEMTQATVTEGYGITECSPVLTINRFGNRKEGVGKPIAPVKIAIVDLQKHNPVAQGQQGLIVVRGSTIFNGYFNTDVHSPFMPIDGQQWYSTGDLGYLTPTGALVISGRLKRFVKIGGEMISLGAIEDVLNNTIGKEQSFEQEGPTLAIASKEEPGEKSKIVLFTSFPVFLEEANQKLRESGFSNLIKIHTCKQLEEIPLMGTGKINYRALESMLLSLLEEKQDNHLSTK